MRRSSRNHPTARQHARGDSCRVAFRIALQNDPESLCGLVDRPEPFERSCPEQEAVASLTVECVIGSSVGENYPMERPAQPAPACFVVRLSRLRRVALRERRSARRHPPEAARVIASRQFVGFGIESAFTRR